MHARRLLRVAGIGLVVVAAGTHAAAAPTQSGNAPPVSTAGPQPVARPLAPRLLGVRPAPGAYTSGRFGWEIELENPFDTTTKVTAVIQDPPGAAVYTLRPKQRGFFPFSRAYLTDACTERQTWTMWIEATPDEKRTFQMTPNCTFKASIPPTVTAVGATAQRAVGSVSYASPSLKTASPVCGAPLLVEAVVTNRATQPWPALALDLGHMRQDFFSIGPSATKTVAAGQMLFRGFRGRLPLRLRDATQTNKNPAVLPGSAAVAVKAECHPSFHMLYVAH